MRYNNLSDDEIVKVVREYLNDNVYNYAILIDGDWGTGKSYFIKKYLIPKIEKDYIKSEVRRKKIFVYISKIIKRFNKKKGEENKEFIYISLYGINSTEEISRQIYINLLNNKVKVGNTVKKVVSTGVKVLGDIMKNKGLEVSNYREDFEAFVNLNKYILIFDDLERCNCDVNEVLGYINNFVEHDGIKVILIANEKEIGKSYECKNLELRYLLASEDNIDTDDKDNEFTENTELSFSELDTESEDEVKNKVGISIDELKRRAKVIFDEDAIYKKVKEKLIGITIKYEPSFEEIQKKLINEYVNDSDLKSYLEKCIKDNMKYAYEKKHINLRTYQFFLSRIINIYNKIREENDINLDEIMPSIVNYCYKICVDYKCGEYKYEWKESEKYKYNRLDYINKNKYEFEFKYKFVDDYIISSKLYKSELVNAINLSLKEREEYKNNLNDVLYKLELWWELDDDKVEELMKKCIGNLSNNKYPSSKFDKILDIFVCLESIGFSSEYLNKVIEFLKNSVNSENIIDLEIYTPTLKEKNVVDKYKEIVNELKEIINQQSEIESEDDINKYINDTEDWGKKLFNYVIINPDYISIDKSFMQVIDLEKLISKIKESNSYNISFFRYTISEFYDPIKISNNDINYIKDKSKIEMLINSLRELDNNKFDNIKNMNIQLLIEVLEKICKFFKN